MIKIALAYLSLCCFGVAVFVEIICSSIEYYKNLFADDPDLVTSFEQGQKDDRKLGNIFLAIGIALLAIWYISFIA